jgi:alkylation response protein AidB-like acyl-CoA dehydrogenase
VNLEYGERYARLRAELREFLKGWPPTEEEVGLPRAAQEARFRQRGVERGYVYRDFPRRYGGSEQPADALADAIIREEYRRAGAPGDILLQGPMLLAPTLLACGSEEQKQRFIPPTLRGEMVWCQGYSEPGAGSDLASLASRAVLEGDRWVIHGHKIWTSRAKQADWMFGLFRTEPEAPKHAGISYLLVPMRQPGIEVRPLKQLTGSLEFNEVFLEGAVTAAENLVGKRGEGWQVSRVTLLHERRLMGSPHLLREQWSQLLALARRSVRDGRPALQDPALRQRLAALEGYLRCAETTAMRQLTASARGEEREVALSLLVTKLYSTELGERIARCAYDLLGAQGLLAPAEADVQEYGNTGTDTGFVEQYLFSLGPAIAGGASNIQRNLIGERGLGLPRDLRRQK